MQTDVTHAIFHRAILSHQCETLSRDKVADAATVKLHAATLPHKQKHGFCATFPFHDPPSTRSSAIAE